MQGIVEQLRLLRQKRGGAVVVDLSTCTRSGRVGGFRKTLILNLLRLLRSVSPFLAFVGLNAPLVGAPLGGTHRPCDPWGGRLDAFLSCSYRRFSWPHLYRMLFPKPSKSSGAEGAFWLAIHSLRANEVSFLELPVGQGCYRRVGELVGPGEKGWR